MNCAMCMYVDANVTGGPFMYQGTSYCKRHLVLAMQPSSDASKPKVKWEDDKVQE